MLFCVWRGMGERCGGGEGGISSQEGSCLRAGIY